MPGAACTLLWAKMACENPGKEISLDEDSPCIGCVEDATRFYPERLGSYAVDARRCEE